MTISVPGFESGPIFDQLEAGIAATSPSEREDLVKKVKGLFQLDVKNTQNSIQSWTIDMKSGQGSIALGKSQKKPDVVITVADKDFVDMAQGKLTGQKAFMSGKLKLKGNMMLATKLDTVLKVAQQKSKL